MVNPTENGGSLPLSVPRGPVVVGKNGSKGGSCKSTYSLVFSAVVLPALPYSL